MSESIRAVTIAAMHRINAAFPSSNLGEKQLDTWLDVIRSQAPDTTPAEMDAATRRLIVRGSSSGSFIPTLHDLVAELVGRIERVQVRYRDIWGHVDPSRPPSGTLRLRVPPGMSPPAFVDDREADKLQAGGKVAGCHLVALEDRIDYEDTPRQLDEHDDSGDGPIGISDMLGGGA